MQEKAEEIVIGGVSYVTLDYASKSSGYDREYLRKLAVAKKIIGTRVGESWVVNLKSIEDYKNGKPQRKPHKD